MSYTVHFCSLALKQLALGILAIYRTFLSPALHLWAGPAAGCRHNPSCSVFAQTSIRSDGALTGGLRALKRLSSCHPFGPHAMPATQPASAQAAQEGTYGS